MAGPTPPFAETRRILALAWPVVLTSLNWTVLHVTDVIVVGLTGTEQAAALGASRALTYPLMVVAIGWLAGVLVFTARAEGAGERAATGALLRHGLAAGLLLGLVAAAVLIGAAAPMLRALGVAPGLVPHAAQVVRVMALAYPVQLLTVAASYFLEGVSRPRRVMAVNLLVLPFNAVGAWAWSGGHLGLPAWGASGAAAATVAASLVGTGAVLLAAWRLPDARERGIGLAGGWAFGDLRRGIARLLGFGTMPALASGLELTGFSVLIGLSTRLGPTTAHAFQIVFSVHNVTFGVALGFASAAGVRVGNAVGAGTPDQALRRAAVAAALAMGITLALAAGLLLGRQSVAALFPAADPVRHVAVAMLLVWPLFIPFDAGQAVCVSALRSLGDQVTTGVNSIVAFFVATGGAGIVLVRSGWGAKGLVLASGSGMVLATLLHGLRLWRVTSRFRPRS